MLKTRIIPVLQWDGVQAVKTTQFRLPPRPVGSMMQHIMNMQNRDIDELIIIDINATREGREPAYDKVEEYAAKLFCPLTIGGGISKIEHIKYLLNAGADKVAIKTATEIIPKACEKFGAQSIVQVVDFGGSEPWVDFSEQPGEVLITSIAKEGKRAGYNLMLIKCMKSYWKCPIIANGGCGEPKHMLEAIKAGADAVAASSIFLFTEYTPKSCAKYLHEKGIQVRIE